MVNTRIEITPEQWKAIKLIAFHREQPLQVLLAVALEQSPVTRQAFKDAGK